MKLKRTGLVRVGAWILTGLLAADIGLQLGGVEIGSKWEWREMGRRFSERLLKGAVKQAAHSNAPHLAATVRAILTAL